MNSKPLLALFTGILVHDHWKPYFKLGCLHALCNAHHLRELTFAYEQEGQAWAKNMLDLLDAILQAVDSQGGTLTVDQAGHYREQYRAVLAKAEQECPLPHEPEGTKRRGRIKRTKSRNLLENACAIMSRRPCAS